MKISSSLCSAFRILETYKCSLVISVPLMWKNSYIFDLSIETKDLSESGLAIFTIGWVETFNEEVALLLGVLISLRFLS